MAALGSNMKGRSKKSSPEVVEEIKEVKAAKKATKSKPKKPTSKKEEKPALKLKKAEIILEPSKRRKIRKIRVYLQGDLSINNVEAFLQQVHPIFDNYDYVDFSLRKVTALDLSFIQMLYHVKKNYGKKQKEVTIDSDLSKELKTVIVHAGFEELMFIPKLV